MDFYTLIIWSMLCTSVDATCETGDWTVVRSFTADERRDAHTNCDFALRAWLKAGADHRGVCYAGPKPPTPADVL